MNLASVEPQVATFASGCFWGVEHIFLKHFPPAEEKGILKTAVGYTGGKEGVASPDYRTVCSGTTDHAEAVRIEFDPTKVTYDELVGTYFVWLPWRFLLTRWSDWQSSSIGRMTLQQSTDRELIPVPVRHLA